MKNTIRFSALFFFAIILLNVTAQQQVTVLSRCGGTQTVTIPTITDNDLDGMDDLLEEKLLQYFTPAFIQFSNDNCPGPAVDGSGDSNLVVNRIYPLPQQYTFSTNPDSLKIHPIALVPAKGLVTGLIWYEPMVKVNAALLYGKDCGMLGHTADVEGFNYSLKYIGPDSLAGWMYDTAMQHWKGGTIQTVSHAGTLCEHIETQPYSSVVPDTIYNSPNKHGGYLTISGCNSSFICDPGCNGTQSRKNVKPVNIGEPNASLVTDLGAYYPGYAGEDPWSNTKFLNAYGGNAGTIRSKMLLSLASVFVQGYPLTSAAQICSLYTNCFGVSGSSLNETICKGKTFSFNGSQLTAQGVYYANHINSYGCDSIVTLQLTVADTSSANLNVATCGTEYSFNGHSITQSGVYRDTLQNANGCDSIVTLQLDLKQPSAYSYTVKVCPGSSYNFNGQLLTNTGIYYDTLSNAVGCDSVVSLYFTVDSVPPLVWANVTDTIYLNTHAVLLVAQPSGGVYSGAGVYGNIFFPDSVGEGTHTVTYTYTNTIGCSASITHNITVLATSAEWLTDNTSIAIFPNPAENVLHVVSDMFLSNKVKISVLNSLGEVVSLQHFDYTATITLDVSALTRGVYFLKAEYNNRIALKKFVR
ncbi:MAG: T9SS type A sorting domain-containing protein [Chitinophagales bacterium]|nr:T9SS type A sorting domain-containing protein [Chitinophagales bacterium]